MTETIDNLSRLIQQEKEIIDAKIKDNNTPFLFIDLMRAIDSYWLADYPDKENFDSFLKFGFPYFLNRFYKTSSFNEPVLPKVTSTVNSLSFCHYWLYQYGKCRFAERALELARNEEISIKAVKENAFILEASPLTTVEYIENKSITEYFRVMRKYVIKYEIENQQSDEERITELMNLQVQTWDGHIHTYGNTPEIDNHYYQEGYIHLASTQLFDDFDEEFTFGGIPYKHILEVLQAVIGDALRHRDACLLLLTEKSNVNLYDILSTPICLEDLYPSYAKFLNLGIDSVRKIFELLVVSDQNIETHLKEDKDFSPLFVKVGSKFVVRSIKGCLAAPVLFMQGELKRQYYDDYFRWINERESTFRRQLYGLFDDDRFVKIDRNININSSGIRTDIDAVVFDKHTKSLGLFQLKWQDKYAADLTARKSRITNFYPSAKKWIEKMDQWSTHTPAKELLNALNIDDKEISNIYLFVIGRYNTHFSNQVIDERAAWASWYHTFEVSHKIGKNQVDPIRELYNKLQWNSPRNKRVKRSFAQPYQFELSNCSLTWKYV